MQQNQALSDVYDSAAGLPQPDPSVNRCRARRVKRRERNARRWRLLIASSFTRELVLGMHNTALQPTSKPGRPHCSVNILAELQISRGKPVFFAFDLNHSLSGRGYLQSPL